jgi:hypothetical protein
MSKERFYFDINSHDIEVLVSKIKSGNPEYSIEKMMDNGLLPVRAQAVRERIKEEVEKEEEKEEEDKIIIKAIARKKQIIDFCNEIYRDEIGLDEIKIKIQNGFFTMEEIDQYIGESLLSNETLDKIKYFIFNKKEILFYEWKDLPAIQPNRTDVYFFGQPQSGKSCILANFFSYLHKKGLLIENPHCLIGTKYKNTIYNEFNLGFLPPSTLDVADGVNYIPFELLNPKIEDREHPLNLIEMSGELFNKAAEEGISDDNLNSKNYLSNKNRKIIFFIIDYDKHIKNKQNPDGSAPQEPKMVLTLSLLERFGTFNQTDEVIILVSKADLFPENTDALNFSNDFIEDNYATFLSNLKKYKRQYNEEFKIKIFPFSIGKLNLKKTYVYEPDYFYTEHIVKELLSNTKYVNTRESIFNIFKRKK